MRIRAGIVVIGMVAATAGAAPDRALEGQNTVGTPAELPALVAKAKIDGAIAAWCRGEFQTKQRGAFAVAMTIGAGGRYVVVYADARSTPLGSFKGRPDLACYSRSELEKLDRSIRASDTIDGRVTPRWGTTAVCGFIDDTTAECWQYSPTDRAFVKIGGWTT